MSTHHFIPISIIAGFLSFGPPTRAAIIYSGLLDLAIPLDFSGIFLDVDAGLSDVASFSGWDVNAFFGGSGLGNSPSFQPVRNGTGQLDPIIRLDLGAPVDGSLSFASGFGGSGNPNSHFGLALYQFAVGIEGYIGFKFSTNAGVGPYYGWMRAILTNNTAGGVVRDWAYDSSGVPIVVGAVPESGTATLLAAGMLVVSFARRRRA